MDTITTLDFAFGVVTTLILGALTVAQFRSETLRQRSEAKAAALLRSFEDTQFALDIQASTSTVEIVSLLAKSARTQSEIEFVKRTHTIAQARLDAMSTFTKLDASLKSNVEQALQRLVEAIGDDPEVQVRQAAINDKYGTKVQTDRSAYSWDGAGRYSKFELMHLIAQRFIAENSITTRPQFDDRFGSVVTGVLGTQVGGKKFAASRLLDAIAVDKRYADRDLKLSQAHGPIRFDSTDYRAGWALGFAGAPDMGRAVQLPVIEYFRGQPGYDIAPV